MSSLFLNTATNPKITTAIVVTLTPPAVEPEPPPINISISVKI